jgi:hypothetical protein
VSNIDEWPAICLEGKRHFIQITAFSLFWLQYSSTAVARSGHWPVGHTGVIHVLHNRANRDILLKAYHTIYISYNLPLPTHFASI